MKTLIVSFLALFVVEQTLCQVGKHDDNDHSLRRTVREANNRGVRLYLRDDSDDEESEETQQYLADAPIPDNLQAGPVNYKKLNLLADNPMPNKKLNLLADNPMPNKKLNLLADNPMPNKKLNYIAENPSPAGFKKLSSLDSFESDEDSFSANKLKGGNDDPPIHFKRKTLKLKPARPKSSKKYKRRLCIVTVGNEICVGEGGEGTPPSGSGLFPDYGGGYAGSDEALDSAEAEDFKSKLKAAEEEVPVGRSGPHDAFQQLSAFLLPTKGDTSEKKPLQSLNINLQFS